MDFPDYHPEMPKDLGHDLLADQAALAEWVADTQSKENKTLYNDQLRARVIRPHFTPHPFIANFDALRSDLYASVTLLTMLLKAPVETEYNHNQDEKERLVGHPDAASLARIAKLVAAKPGIVDRRKQVNASLMPLEASSIALTAAMRQQLDTLQDKHEHKTMDAPPDSYLTNLQGNHALCETLKQQLTTLGQRVVEQIRTNSGHDNTENYMLDFCNDRLIPRIGLLTSLVAERSPTLYGHWPDMEGSPPWEKRVDRQLGNRPGGNLTVVPQPTGTMHSPLPPIHHLNKSLLTSMPELGDIRAWLKESDPLNDVGRQYDNMFKECALGEWRHPPMHLRQADLWLTDARATIELAKHFVCVNDAAEVSRRQSVLAEWASEHRGQPLDPQQETELSQHEKSLGQHLKQAIYVDKLVREVFNKTEQCFRMQERAAFRHVLPPAECQQKIDAELGPALQLLQDELVKWREELQAEAARGDASEMHQKCLDACCDHLLPRVDTLLEHFSAYLPALGHSSLRVLNEAKATPTGNGVVSLLTVRASRALDPEAKEPPTRPGHH